MGQDKEKRVLYINHSGELLMWLIVMCVIVGVFSTSNILKTRRENSYKIFMPDVDGLIVGSPVRTMGIEIGHVTRIKPIKDEVYVKFLVTDKSVKIPQGTKATVEFSGMAGSKSLELYLPDETTYIDESTPMLTVSPPKRLHEAIGLLNDMFKEIGSMITTSSIFSKKIQDIDIPKVESDGGNAFEFLEYADNLVDIQRKRVDDFGRKLNYGRKR